MNKWQPIESAPKDGSVLLIFGDDEISIAFWEIKNTIGSWRCIGYGILAYEDNGGPYYGPSRLIHQNPTHWMRLPNKPY